MTYVRADVDTKSIHREGDVLFATAPTIRQLILISGPASHWPL